MFQFNKNIHEIKEKKDKIEENMVKRKLTRELEILNKISNQTEQKRGNL